MIALLIILSLLIPLLAYIVTAVISPRISFPTKRERFESGNPPIGRARGYFLMQYYPYLLMFTSLEPLLIMLLFLILIPYTSTLVYILISLIVIIIPSFVYAYKHAEEIDLWRED